MTRKNAILIATLPALALLSGCGNDLESRQEAANELQPSERFVDGEPSVERGAARPNPEPTSFAEDEEDLDGEAEEEEADLIVDAAPEDLIDTAQGFSPEPMDDAQGFDPSPSGQQEPGN